MHRIIQSLNMFEVIEVMNTTTHSLCGQPSNQKDAQHSRQATTAAAAAKRLA
jgi:hypothetical protein